MALIDLQQLVHLERESQNETILRDYRYLPFLEWFAQEMHVNLAKPASEVLLDGVDPELLEQPIVAELALLPLIFADDLEGSFFVDSQFIPYELDKASLQPLERTLVDVVRARNDGQYQMVSSSEVESVLDLDAVLVVEHLRPVYELEQAHEAVFEHEVVPGAVRAWNL